MEIVCYICPRPKEKNMAQLTEAQRYTISSMYTAGFSQKRIAETINRDKSVISREIKRNKNPKTGKYSFKYAQSVSNIRKERLRRPRRLTSEVENRILRYLKEDWSPEQIVGYSRVHGYAMVSIERIYQYIRSDKLSGGNLYKHCRHMLKHRKRPVGKQEPIKNRVGIEQRPPQADGTRFGDWEMDLIVWHGNKDAMLTLVERSTGYTIIRLLPEGKKAAPLAKIVIDALVPFKKHVRTITTDNGSEFAKHEDIAEKLDTCIYFTHPYSSWEKGLIENTNKLYRQYFPKKTSFSDINDLVIKQIQYKLNNRPGKKLNYDMPYKMFYLHLE